MNNNTNNTKEQPKEACEKTTQRINARENEPLIVIGNG
jgi:hypothetical protein